MPSTPAGPYAPSTPTLAGPLDHAGVHQDIADDIVNLSTGAAAETSARIAGDAARQVTAEKGAANGYPTLDATGKVPAAQLPAVSGAPTGPAGGSLSGTYPNPTVAAGVITTGNLAFDVATQTELDAEATARANADALAIPLTQKGAANGVPTLDSTSHVPRAQLGTGTADTTTFLRGDGAWQTPAGGGGAPALTPVAVSGPTYTASVGDDILADISGSSLTVTLPTNPADSSPIRVRVFSPSGTGANFVQFTAGSGDAVDFSAATIRDGMAWVWLQYDKTAHQWRNLQGSTPQYLPLNRLAPPLGNVDMGGMKLTNLFAASAAGDAVRLSQTVTSSVNGLAPASGGGTTNFLRADGTWNAPPFGASLTALHSALLGVKVWSGSAYVWSGDGTAPDSNAYTSILFIDPAGTHDPATSTGGRSNANDLWETGGGGGGSVSTTGGGKEAVNTQASASGAVTLDLSLGNVQALTLTGNVTSLTVTNTTASVSCTFTLVVKQDSTGSRTLAWMTGAKWSGGVAPTISSAANKVDIFTFMSTDNGTTWYGFIAGQDMR